MYSHPLKPVKQLSSQTMQDTASQKYKTYWNYFHSNHNNNMPGQDLQDLRWWWEHAHIQHPTAVSSAPCTGARFGNCWPHPKQALASLLCPVLMSKALHPSAHTRESHGAGSPGPKQAQAALYKTCSSFFILTCCNHLGLRSLSLQC